MIINLKNFYPVYTQDEYIEVSEDVAAVMIGDKRYEKSHEQRMGRNKSFYSLDVEDNIETSAIVCYNNSPERIFDFMQRHCDLCRALNSLPEIQGRRVEAHYLLAYSQKEIAKAEGVSENAVNKSIQKGLGTMKNFLKKNLS